MQSVRIHSYGNEDIVQIEEIEKPNPGPGELLVRVAAASINPVDIGIRNGKYKDFLKHTFPLTLGCDLAGTVELGEGFSAGDNVYAYLSLMRLGAFAEYAIVKTEEAALAPQTLDVVHQASLPVAALTAWQMLFDLANLDFGQSVLIHGASGGVGSMAVQLAKWKGAHVIATASGANREYVMALGADEFVDYKTERFEDTAKDMDVVVDVIGGETLERSFATLKPTGFLVSAVQPPAPDRGVRTAMAGVQPDGARLKEITSLIEQNVLKTLVENTFPLAQVKEAFALSAKGGTRGKIVLTVA